MKRVFSILAVLVMCAAFCAASAEADWQSAFRELIETGEYESYLSNPDMEYNNMLLDRDAEWDRFALYDFDDNGIPELIVLSEYGLEQADVFVWNGSRALWAGMVGGENFFQGFMEYPEYPPAGLIALMGGPAMEIYCCTLSDGKLVVTEAGRTTVDSEGMETVGINMYTDDSRLSSLLYASLVSYDGSEVFLEDWASLDELVNQGQWDLLFR